MGAKQNKCCCCPDCTANPGKCCACIPETICLTFTVYGQDPCSGELDWDRVNKRFSGTVCNHDILLYFERDEYDGKCYFKLRSTSLGFPEGYEHEWEVGAEIDCETLTASVDTDEGLLEITAVEFVNPDECTGCKCLCECICVTLNTTRINRPYDAVPGEGDRICRGKLCWDYTIHGYTGTLTCFGAATYAEEATILLRPRHEYDPESPYDESCVAVIQLPGMGIEKWIPLPDCNRSLTFETTINEGYDESYPDTDDYIGYQHVVSVTCAECNDDCIPNVCCDEHEGFENSDFVVVWRALGVSGTGLEPPGLEDMLPEFAQGGGPFNPVSFVPTMDINGNLANLQEPEWWGFDLVCENDEYRWYATYPTLSGGDPIEFTGQVYCQSCDSATGPYTYGYGRAVLSGDQFPWLRYTTSDDPDTSIPYDVEIEIFIRWPCDP